MYKSIFIALLISFLSIACVAQNKNFSSTDKKTIQLYTDAETFYIRMEYKNSEDMVLKTLKRDPNFAEAIALYGYIKIAQKDFAGAIQKFEEVLRINPLLNDAIYLDLGTLYFKTAQYEKCIKPLNVYLNEKKPTNAQNKFNAQNFLASAQFAMEAVKNPVPFKPENLGPGVNSELKEYLPVVSTDQNMIVFTRTIPDKMSPNGFQEDFFVSFNSDKGWGKAMNMGAPLNTHVNEGGHTLTADGRAMVFTICEQFGDYGPGRQGLGSCDLFVSYKTDKGWSAPKNLGPNINSKFFDSQPAVSPDGSEIFFSSTRTPGYGKTDIYRAEVTPKGISKPENLGPLVNTPGREEGVFLHPDGQTLFFSSDGHPGMGGADIFMTKRNADGTWGKPANLGFPINSNQDEIAFTVDALGEYAYFTSDREGGYGDWDIYKFKMPEHLKPNPVNYLKGIVYDADTKEKIQASFELIDLSTKKVIVASNSTPGSGEFLVVLPSGRDYALNVSKDGYMFHSENFTLTTPKNFEPYKKDVPLVPFKEGGTVVLKNVFFDTDSYVLKPKSEAELDKLYDFLVQNAKIKIEIGGHTDNQGKLANNKILSKNRAEAVKNYLTTKGIDTNRLTFQGYADEKPIDTNETPEGRANNRRTEFKIIGK
jgi:outer membrane protein OmpA-like peptidoglycan-associated protein